MKRTIIIHPFLFSIYPILFLYSQNIEEVASNEVFSILGISIVCTVILWLGFNFFFGEAGKAGLLLSLSLVFFFSFGHFYVLINDLSGEIHDIESKQPFVSSNAFFVVWVIAFIVVFCLLKNINQLSNKVTVLLNFIALLLTLFAIIIINGHFFHAKNQQLNYVSLTDSIKSDGIDQKIEVGKKLLPDIYYIIPDYYAGNKTLKDIYDFDNSEFLGYLSKRGFYVATESNANYLRTLHSVASSVNMRYVNYLSSTVGENSQDESPLYNLIKRSEMVHFLKAKGYKYIFSGGEGWESDLVDKFIYWKPSSDFLYIFCKSTILYETTLNQLYPTFRKKHWKIILYQFQKLTELAQIRPYKEPMFIFAHILIPHSPMVFSKTGDFLPLEKTKSLIGEARYPLYVEQLMFANKKLKELIDTILSQPGKNKPIIILQSDEGVYPIRVWHKTRTFKWEKATSDELRIKQRILNAYYLPDVDSDKVLYQSISPVNSFRVILNSYFNENLPLLQDKVYAFTDWHHPYKLFDVTNIVQ